MSDVGELLNTANSIAGSEPRARTTYIVKEIFKTLQGEGGQAGRVAVFLRFAGCNLWSGREADRDQAACSFCDTDFIIRKGDEGARFRSAQSLADAVQDCWGSGRSERLVVCTGGEPLLQLDASLIAELKDRGFAVAVETNGTIAAPEGLDWICVSPKGKAPLRQVSGQELKLVYPQPGVDPQVFTNLGFTRFLLQPLDAGDQGLAHTNSTIDYCFQHPEWRLSVQTHKHLGIR